MKKIMIIGDSHTRSFALRNNIYPVFLGSGKKINLSNTSLIYLEKQLVKLFKKVNQDDYQCFIYLGEPNVRYQLMNNWYPHLEDKIKVNVNKSYLSKCASNYIKIAEKYKLSIITPTSGIDECIIPMKYFTKCLLKNKTTKTFIVDLFSQTIKSLKIIDEYKNQNYSEDPIHLNSKVCDLFLDILLEQNFITKDDRMIFFKKITFNQFDNRDLIKTFNNNKFNTLSIKEDSDNIYFRIIKKIFNNDKSNC